MSEQWLPSASDYEDSLPPSHADLEATIAQQQEYIAELENTPSSHWLDAIEPAWRESYSTVRNYVVAMHDAVEQQQARIADLQAEVAMLEGYETGNIQTLAAERERAEKAEADAKNWWADVSRWKQNFKEVNEQLAAERERATHAVAEKTAALIQSDFYRQDALDCGFALKLTEDELQAERERAEDYKRHTERLDKEYRDVLAELQAEREK